MRGRTEHTGSRYRRVCLGKLEEVAFSLPGTARSFTLTVDGQRHTQSLAGIPSESRERGDH